MRFSVKRIGTFSVVTFLIVTSCKGNCKMLSFPELNALLRKDGIIQVLYTTKGKEETILDVPQLKDLKDKLVNDIEIMSSPTDRGYLDAMISVRIELTLRSKKIVIIGYAYDDYFFLNAITEKKYLFKSSTLLKFLRKNGAIQ